MNGRTAKLLRKAANNEPQKVAMLKHLYNLTPKNKRHIVKEKSGDLAELYRQQHEFSKMSFNPPIEVKADA